MKAHKQTILLYGDDYPKLLLRAAMEGKTIPRYLDSLIKEVTKDIEIKK